MAAKDFRIPLEKREKIIRYILNVLWFAFTTIIAVVLYRTGMETNNNGEFCDYNIWESGLIYQWIWYEGEPCIFSLEYYIIFAFFMVPLYLLYDYVRRKIIGFNPNFVWRITEVGIWFILNWGYLLWLTATDYGTLNLIMGWTSFVGTLLFFVPIILLTGGVRFLSNRVVLWIFFGILFSYVGLIIIAINQ